MHGSSGYNQIKKNLKFFLKNVVMTTDNNGGYPKY